MLQITKRQFIQLQKTTLNLKIRKVLVVTVLMAVATVSNAQFNYGFKLSAGGACQSDLLEIANNCDIVFSPGFGVIGKYQFTDGFALKSGLEYQKKGRSMSSDDFSENAKLHYLNLPLKAEYSAGEKAGFKKGQRLYFAAGPYLSYLLSADGEQNDVSFDLKSDTKDFDFGLALELGIEFPVFTDKALQLGLNYDMGFIEVYKSQPDLHNKMASISLGMLF